MDLRAPLALLAVSSLAGCAAESPERVFRESTCAFAAGDIEEGASHFSKRLLAARPIRELEAYYLLPERRKGIDYLLKDHRFRIVREDTGTAVGEVTWTTGRTEPVYFVREGGRWKLDLPAREGPPPGTPPEQGPPAAPLAPPRAAPPGPQPGGTGP